MRGARAHGESLGAHQCLEVVVEFGLVKRMSQCTQFGTQFTQRPSSLGKPGAIQVTGGGFEIGDFPQA